VRVPLVNTLVEELVSAFRLGVVRILDLDPRCADAVALIRPAAALRDDASEAVIDAAIAAGQPLRYA